MIIFVYNKKQITMAKSKMDFKKMGFKNEKEYNDFLEEKWQSLKKKLEKPEILAIFKRLADR
jgi:hypothetical protein